MAPLKFYEESQGVGAERGIDEAKQKKRRKKRLKKERKKRKVKALMREG